MENAIDSVLNRFRTALDEAYGNRLKHPHVYPEWFPQAAVNPVPAWIYPASALGAFHVWMYKNYIPQNFPKYVGSKMKAGTFLPGRAAQLIQAMARKELPGPK